MWKVIVIFCFFNYDCILLEEKPMNYYVNEVECINMANAKHTQLSVAYTRYGYAIKDSKAYCKKVPTI